MIIKNFFSIAFKLNSKTFYLLAREKTKQNRERKLFLHFVRHIFASAASVLIIHSSFPLKLGMMESTLKRRGIPEEPSELPKRLKEQSEIELLQISWNMPWIADKESPPWIIYGKDSASFMASLFISLERGHVLAEAKKQKNATLAPSPIRKWRKFSGDADRFHPSRKSVQVISLGEGRSRFWVLHSLKMVIAFEEFFIFTTSFRASNE